MNYIIFFFKKKTAYEMRISDWSSDVCSSDLRTVLRQAQHERRRKRPNQRLLPNRESVAGSPYEQRCQHHRPPGAGPGGRLARSVRPLRFRQGARTLGRSEEHTSELQSLMRISYAVFCLKKKNTNHIPQHK